MIIFMTVFITGAHITQGDKEKEQLLRFSLWIDTDYNRAFQEIIRNFEQSLESLSYDTISECICNILQLYEYQASEYGV